MSYYEMVKEYMHILSIDEKYSHWISNLIHAIMEQYDGENVDKFLCAIENVLDIHNNCRSGELKTSVIDRLWKIIKNCSNKKVMTYVAEIVGWFGDTRDLQEFVNIDGGYYDLEEYGIRYLPCFEISRYPVTNKWYAEFIEDGGYYKDELWSCEGKRWRRHGNFNNPEYQCDCQWNGPNKPVVGVTWWEADAFCRWLSVKKGDGIYRLPTEEQWQAAAAGREN